MANNSYLADVTLKMRKEKDVKKKSVSRRKV